jgi:hypothetical protein
VTKGGAALLFQMVNQCYLVSGILISIYISES